MAVRILVTDDDFAPRRLLQQALTKAGYCVEVAEGGRVAVALGNAQSFDLALLDVMMPDLDGLDVLRALKAVQPELIVIMMSSFGSIDTAIEAMKGGAYEALACLVAYDWPGNVRELEHMIEQTATLARDTLILPDDLPPKYRQSRAETSHTGTPPVDSAPLTLQEVTARHIRAMLHHAKGNKKRTAELLGIPRRTLYRLAHRYKIEL